MSDIQQKLWDSADGDTVESLLQQLDTNQKLLTGMTDLWKTICDANGWEPEHMIQYVNALAATEPKP